MLDAKLRPCSCEKGGRNATVVEIPDAIFDRTCRQNRTVSIDACIVDAIQSLWSDGIVTLGSCCGHNTERPSVIVCQDQKDLTLVRDVLAQDGRDWRVLQWRIVDVSEVFKPHPLDDLISTLRFQWDALSDASQFTVSGSSVPSETGQSMVAGLRRRAELMLEVARLADLLGVAYPEMRGDS